MYTEFKNNYKIPINFLEIIKEDKYFLYYNSEEEINIYLNKYSQKTDDIFTPFNKEEFVFYMTISKENQFINIIQQNHYFDEGCICKSCSIKRLEVIYKIKSNQTIQPSDNITHIEVVNQNKINSTQKIMQKIEILKKYKQHNKHKPNKLNMNIIY
jgi:hypothetical protein